MTHENAFSAADLRLAYTLAADYADCDTAKMAATWQQAVRKSATVDLLSAVVAALFDTAPELRQRVPQMRAAAADFALIEQMDESQFSQALDTAALADEGEPTDDGDDG